MALQMLSPRRQFGLVRSEGNMTGAVRPVRWDVPRQNTLVWFEEQQHPSPAAEEDMPLLLPAMDS